MTSEPPTTSQHIQRMGNYVEILSDRLIETSKAFEDLSKMVEKYQSTLSEIAYLNPEEYHNELEMRQDIQERARKAIILDEQL